MLSSATQDFNLEQKLSHHVLGIILVPQTFITWLHGYTWEPETMKICIDLEGILDVLKLF